MSHKIQSSHCERLAVVYLRQSTMRQVHENQESRARQHALRDRAIALGWTPDAVRVVDEDLGRSGTSTAERTGFQRLAEDVAHGRVGAIFALEPSRLSRRSSDWHRLLELCRFADVLIVDEAGVYAPQDPNDSLLLGLKGQMSEAELYWMRLRLQGGKLSKARRGDLYIQPPTGYQWDRATNRFRLDPDEQVQRAIRLVFERFRIDGSGHAVGRYFGRKKLQMPARMTEGEVRWGPPRHGVILGMLRNPLYTGTYVYGRRQQRPVLVDGRILRKRTTRLPQESWKVCLPDHHPAYISWKEFMDNEDKLNQNRTDHRRSPDRRGAAREGPALLQGIVLCGKCGSRMHVGYQGPNHRHQYECRSPRQRLGVSHGVCWVVPGSLVDKAVAELFLSAAQPPELELSLAVAREAEQQGEELAEQWRLRLERVRYDARLAERRYKAVDPDNRVVARTLERDWEECLREVERTEREYEEVRTAEKVELTAGDRKRILALARDLPRLWRSASTTHAQRKNLVRTLISEVSLTPVDVPRRQVRLQVLWDTGATSELHVDRPALKTPPEIVALVGEHVEGDWTLAESAAELNRQGLHTATGRTWTPDAVSRVRKLYRRSHPTTTHRAAPNQRADGRLTRLGVAARLEVTPDIVSYWIERGLLHPEPGTSGQGRQAWFELDDATIQRLRDAKARGHGARSADAPNSPKSRPGDAS